MKMKNANFFVVAFTMVMSLTLLSCAKKAVEFSASPSIEKSVNAASSESANVFNSQQTWEVDRVMLVPCANNGEGEDVLLYGYVHFTDHFSVNGNRFTLVSQANYNEVSGVGLFTGDRYVANGGGRFTLQGDLLNGQFIASGTDQLNLIGSGPDNNFKAIFKGRIIVNANGTVTHEVVNVEITCK